jgi:uncharacterized membrane protein YsdA (DUF1294 family)
MRCGFDFTPRWRIASTTLLLCALTGGVVFRIVTSRGPSWVFFAISAGVLALVAIDMWDKLRAARTALRAPASSLDITAEPKP